MYYRKPTSTCEDVYLTEHTEESKMLYWYENEEKTLGSWRTCRFYSPEFCNPNSDSLGCGDNYPAYLINVQQK